MRPLTDLEVSRILAELLPRDRCLFVLGLRTGFRISELLSLRLGDVWQGGAVLEAVAVARKSMKGKGEGRTVPLHPLARAELASWAAVLVALGAGPDAHLFTTRTGKPIGRVRAWQLLTDAYKRAGVFGRIGTHGMRKSFAARMYDRLKHDLIKTQKAMGHKSVTSTASYLSFAESEVNDAITGGV